MPLLRFLAGVLLLPLSTAMVLTLADLAAPAGLFTAPPGWLLGGFVAWCAVWLLLPQPVVVYVFGHELTHLVWAKAMGAEVSGFEVGRAAGSVRVSKSNILIALAPYFFPVYTVLLIVGAAVAGLFVDLSPHANLLLGLVGATWGFHFTFTLHALALGQSDLKPYGLTLSYAVIVFMNAAGLVLAVVCAAPPTLEDAVHRFSARTVQAYTWTARTARAGWERVVVPE